MSSDLEWKIEEGETPSAWHSAAPQPPRRRLPNWSWRRWLALALALAVVIGAPAAWLINRVNETERAQRQAVRNVAELEDRLLAAGDNDALRTLQDPNYPGWRTWYTYSGPHPAETTNPDASAVLVETWSATGTHTYRVGASAPGDVQLSGDTAALSVTTVYTPYLGYAPDLGMGVAFTLRGTRYYRSVDGGWVRTGPPADLSRNVIEVHGDMLILRYLRSDASAVEPLVARLLALASLACRDLGCPAGPVTLSLSANPQEVLQSAGGRTEAVYAPGPALLGVPVDDAGYDAFYRLYGTLLVAHIAGRRSGGMSEPVWPWLHWELTRLHLEPALSQQALQQVARNSLQSGVNPLLLGDDREAGIWLALDFLAANEGRNPLGAILAEGRVVTLAGTLYDMTEERSFLWWNYLEQVAALPAQYPGDAQLAMVCSGAVRLWNASTGVYRSLNLTAAEAVWSTGGHALIADIPGSEFTLLDMDSGQTWHSALPLLGWAPGGRAVVRQNTDRFIWDPTTGDSTALAAGLGWIAWSPDEHNLAFARGSDIYVAAPAAPDGSNAAPITTGASGLWSPGGRYLAVISASFPITTLEVYDTGTAQLLQVPMPADSALTSLDWSPDETRLAIATMDALRSNQDGTVRVIDLQGQVSATWVIDSAAQQLQWSPDGTRVGWLAFLRGNEYGSVFAGTPTAGGEPQRLDVTFLRIDASAPWPRWSWSPDGQWLAVGGNGVTVWSSDFKIERPLPDNCYAPSWRPALR
jgi:hypothetical protein